MRRPAHSPQPLLLLALAALLLATLARAASAAAGTVAPDQASIDFSSAARKARSGRRDLPVITVEQLRSFDGKNESLPLLVALDRRVYDVSTKRDVYGPGGGYATFSGRDSTRNFALYSTESKDDGSCIDDLAEKDLKMLAEWRRWFDERYPLVAVITEKLCENDDSPEDAARRGFARPGSARPPLTPSSHHDETQQKPFAADNAASSPTRARPAPSQEL